MQVYDVQNFCNQYFNKFKSFDNLFVCVELSYITYRSIGTVKARDGIFKNQDITPVVMAKGTDVLNNETGGFGYIIQFVRKSNDYLDIQEPLFTKVPEEHIDPNDVKRVKDFATQWLLTRFTNYIEHIEYMYVNLSKIRKFLIKRNIPFLIYSAAVSDDAPEKVFIDTSIRSLTKDKRVIPLSAFSGKTISSEYSIEEYTVHPDKSGHKAIGRHLYDWLVKYDLHKKPNPSIIAV
jgi:lysophospholipase L1-like esterase